MSMNAERLQQLIAAYGADPRRWPEAERDSGRALLAAGPDQDGPDWAVAVEAARDLDHRLWASPPPAVSVALRDRVLASAATAGLTPRRMRLWRDRLALVFGAGWAAAACAGVAAGIVLSAQISADASADAVLYQASQSTLDDSEMAG